MGRLSRERPASSIQHPAPSAQRSVLGTSTSTRRTRHTGMEGQVVLLEYLRSTTYSTMSIYATLELV
jgi:hypothetical protein